MKKTRTRIHEDMLIHREKIRTESNSLRVENTSEDLSASIICIESNKLEQEVRQGYNKFDFQNIIIIQNQGNINYIDFENEKITLNRNDNRVTNVKIPDALKKGDYTVCVKIKAQNTTNNDFFGFSIKNTLQDNLVSKSTTSKNQTELILSKQDLENANSIYFYINNNENENCIVEISELMILKGTYTAETLPLYEKYGTSPSKDFPSEIKGVTGDLKLKVQNKNLAYDIIYSNPKVQYYPFARLKYKLTEGRYYIISYDTENNGFFSYINSGSNYGLRKITDLYSQEHDGSQKKWIVQAINSNLYYEVNLINRRDATSEIGAGRIYNIMIEEIDATTDEEALNYLPSKYVEHKEKEFTISLGNKTLYKGDKIVRQNGKWYFSRHWKEFNRAIVADDIGRVPQGFYIIEKVLTNIKKNTKLYSLYQKEKTVNDAEWNTFDGNYISQLYPNNHRGVYINYLAETKAEIIEWYNNLNNKFIYELEVEELELIGDENLIKQLDAILLNIYEYDDVTNFDFDNDVSFEIEVEKDNIRLLNSRLDEIEKQNVNTQALSLEMEV